MRQQRRVVIRRILLITRCPSRGCNKVVVIKNREWHVSELPPQMCCPLEMESLVPLMRCKSKHQSPEV